MTWVQTGNAVSGGSVASSPYASEAELTALRTALVATGSTTPRALADRFADVVNVKDFGAKGDGVTDETASIVTAYAAAPSNGHIVFPGGKTYKVSSINVTGKPVTFHGYGATLAVMAGNGAFYKTDHGNLLTLDGFSFTGAAPGLKIAATPSVNTSRDYLVRGCSFAMDAGVYGVSLVGAREGSIAECMLAGPGNGLYLQATVSPLVDRCIFAGSSAGNGVFYDGTGTVYDAGLVITDSEIMGWNVGVDVRYCDWLKISGSTIDYNASGGIILYSQDGALISDNYLGSPNTTPALKLTKGVLGAAPDWTSKIIVTGNTITGHELVAATYDAVSIADSSTDAVLITDNVVTFYTRRGISFTTLADIRIADNYFSPRGGFTTAPVYNQTATGDSRVRITGNAFPAGTLISGMNLAFAKVEKNAGMGALSALQSVGADRGDTSQTLTVGSDQPVQLWATALTANRTVTLSTTGAANGDTFRVVRTGLGAFTLDVGGLRTIPSATAAFVDVTYNGSAWILTGYGTL